MQNRLVVIEGACDGIGKTTQFQLLRNRFQKEGEEVISHHFPSYGTYHGEAVSRYLKGEFGAIKELSTYFVHNLYAMDRAVTWYTKLKKEYEEGKLILLDRYTTSSLIYQSSLFENLLDVKDFVRYVEDLEYQKLGIQKPDCVIFLHAPFDLVTRMREERKDNEGVTNDIHESDLDFMRRVYYTGMFLADYLNWNKVSCEENNSLRSIQDIHEDIYRLVRKK